ncbi:ABC transporter substrate-binding protein [Acrocarpospora catenulata]|uniref:ABC transporter substrate-binding protein n=1 Tax=Acrocarpospora catenulata TaxID=2836182 RepID=UPI001BDABDE7|nr:ABC transporter substrate-binding protein [Acrocarpospora catenulata]
MPILRRARRRRAGNSVVITALAASVALAGCGGSTGAAPAADREAPVVIAVSSVVSLDPGLASNSKANLTVVGNVYAALTRFGADGKLVGDLATEWSQTADDVWTFKLRSGVTFEDGEPLTARTVVSNFERLKNDAKLVAGAKVVSAVREAEATSDTEVVFRTQGTFLSFPGIVAGWHLLPIEWLKTHDPNTEVNASGPYKLVSFAPDQSIKLAVNETYFGEAPQVKSVEYRVFSEQAAIISGVLANEIDVAVQLSPSDLEQFEATGDFITGGRPGNRIHILQVNASKKPWDDPRVREAAAIAIDRATITKTILKGLVEPSRKQPFGIGYVGYQEDLEPWPYDPPRARKLLEEAGAVGARAELAVAEYQFPGGPQTSEVIVEQLKAVGFDAALRRLPLATWSDLLKSEETAPELIFIGEASPSNSSAEATLKYQSKEAYPATNAKGPVSSEIDAAVQAAWTAKTVAEQAAAIKRFTAENIRTVRIIDMWPQPQTYVVSKRIKYTPRADDLNRAYDLEWAK